MAGSRSSRLAPPRITTFPHRHILYFVRALLRILCARIYGKADYLIGYEAIKGEKVPLSVPQYFWWGGSQNPPPFLFSGYEMRSDSQFRSRTAPAILYHGLSQVNGIFNFSHISPLNQ